MKAYKAEITFTAYGKTPDDAIDNLIFDLHEALRGECQNVETEEIDTETEGIDPFEEEVNDEKEE